MKTLALCADDFGASPAIDSAILQLVAAQRLTAVSCFVTGAAWQRDAPALFDIAVDGGVGCGLHWNLTEGRPLSPALAAVWPVLPPLPRLIAAAHLRLLPLAALRDELQAQLDAFERASGRQPEHIDGHQHVHHLPGLRALLADALDSRPGARVRHTGDVRGPGFALKRALIAGTGGAALGRWLVARRRQQNAALFGVYDFQQHDYGALMRRWLQALPQSGALLFCHPGAEPAAAPATDTGDPIAAARLREFGYLRSAAFGDDLAAAGVRLAGA